MPNLFDPLTIGALHLRNRIVMAPLTRSRAGPDRQPNALMAEYYAQRAEAGLILTDARGRRRRSGFVRITLDLTNRNALAILAIIITSTPGTAWIEYEPRNGQLLLHVFDLIEGENTVEGDTEDMTVNDANVLCGNIPTANATVYLIDTVLMPMK